MGLRTSWAGEQRTLARIRIALEKPAPLQEFYESGLEMNSLPNVTGVDMFHEYD